MLDLARDIYSINTVGPELEICPALPWMYFSYVYVGNCFHSCICYLSVQTPSNYIEFLRYQVSKNCKHTVLSHLLVEAQSSIRMENEEKSQESPGMQPSSVVVCSDLTVCASHCLSQNCLFLGHPCAFQESAAGGEANDNSREEVRSVFVPICSKLSPAASWLKMHKQ